MASKIMTDYAKIIEGIKELGWENPQDFINDIIRHDKKETLYEKEEQSAECRNDYIELTALGFNVEVNDSPKHRGFMLTNKDYIQLIIT